MKTVYGELKTGENEELYKGIETRHLYCKVGTVQAIVNRMEFIYKD